LTTIAFENESANDSGKKC